jgi:hypothetical protein
MTWKVSGRSVELCSCKQFCPCWISAEATPDEGWCSGLFGFDVHAGSSDDVDLANTAVAMAADWPGNFHDGGGTARLYIDESASEEQRRELEEIFGGKKEGFISAVWDAVIDEWLPTQIGKVRLDWDGNPALSVEGIGEASLVPVTDGQGQPTTMTGSMSQTALRIGTMQLASSKGSRCADPGLREWHGDDGVIYDFDWSS